MARSRRETLLENAIAYIFDVNPTLGDYVRALKRIGMTEDEVYKDLTEECGINPDDAEDLLNHEYRV